MKYEKDDDRQNRLEKIALTTAGIVAGGALLHKAGATKYLSKAIGDVSHTMKKVSNDIKLTGRKGLTAEKTSELFKKHISNTDSTWKIRRSQTPTIETNKGLFKDLFDLDNIEKIFSDNLRQDRDAHLKRTAFNNLTEQLKDVKNRDKDFMQDLATLVDRTLSRQDIFFEQSQELGKYDVVMSELKKFTKGKRTEGFEGEIANVLTDALERSEEIRNEITAWSKEAKDDYANEFDKWIREKYKAKTTEGDRAATAKDIYEALQEEKARLRETANNETNDFMNTLKARIEKDPEVGDLVVDATRYRMDANNQFYTLSDLRESAERAEEAVSETLVGKLFGTKNLIEGRNAPHLYHMSAGTFDPGLASLQGGEHLLRDSLTFIGDKFYKVTDTGLEHFAEADGRKLNSGRNGTVFGYIDRMSGNSAQKYQDNEFLKFFDVNTKGGEFLEEFKSKFYKFDKDGKGRDWDRNIFKRAVTGYSLDNASEDNIRAFYDDVKNISKMYNYETKGVNTSTVSKLKNTLSDEAKAILSTLESDDPLEAFNALNPSTITNADLKSLRNKVAKDNSLKNTMTRATKSRVIKYDEIVQREIVKEALYKDIFSEKSRTVSGYAVTLSKLEKSGLGAGELENVKDLFNWAVIQEQAGIFSKDAYVSKTLAEKGKAYNNLVGSFRGRNKNSQENYFLQSFKEGVLDFGKRHTSLGSSMDINKNNKLGHQRQQWITTKKAINPLDIIKSINDDTKDTSNMVSQFVKQVAAGRKNMEDVSVLTMLPYHMLNRLVTPFEKFGLGFSNASTGSSFDLLKNIGLKRVLPAAMAVTTLSYLNYESRNLTGTSIGGAFQNAKAQFGLGLRTLTSPLDKYLERQREFNPIADYWLGDHKDKDEYLDYLEYGYDPVRKGRYWSFGSSSEFRGGKISYWEPNKLRQAHSNYRDISIYGSSKEKWKHSLIPTLRHPLSPLRYLANPYWLEEKHAEDRPYPVTGKMFSEGTPWGAILNPTIGELIKPQKKMHQDRLQGTGLDVRSIIEKRNADIKESAQENRVVRIDQSGLTPMMFTPNSMPSMNEAIYNIQVKDGRITSAGYQGQQYVETLDGMGSVDVGTLGDSDVIGQSKLNYGVARLNGSNTFENRAAASWLTGIASLVTSGAVEGSSAVKMIEELNNDIKFRSESTSKGQWFEKGRLHTNPSYQETQRKKLDYVNDMIEFNTKRDFVNDMIYSTKQLTGMYGFLFDQIMPSRKAYRLEHAGNMASFSRSFWDSSVGGVGDDFMEIARRFFPHQNRNVENINPLRNTMPDWLPARFLTGDPFTKVPKGEARLPGAGYETLNKLHSDQYGRYGALDRMKILADIAPLSEEYKIWKKIAKSESKDPMMKKEIAAIEDRVKEQTKEHDFYNYKFIGRDLDEKTAVISEVSNTGKFKVMGSDEEFSLAGIKPLNDEEGNSQVHNFVRAGMKVNLKYEDNDFTKRDSQGRISAIVELNGENLNKQMFESGAAKENETRETLADERFKLSDANNLSGHLWEAVGHLPLPYVHNKYLRINSSLETYKHEQVYGTAYSTWDHPIKGFIKPAFQEAFAGGIGKQAIGAGAWLLSEYAQDNMKGTMRTLADVAFAMANPGAFAGGMIASIPKMKINDSTRNGARIGAAVTLAGFALTNTHNPYLSMANFAALGIAAQEQFKFKGLNHGTGALIGAGIGLALSGLNPESKLTNLSKKWIPDDTEDKWEVEEYFDRLEYLKYNNLFHKAAREAKRKEGVDVERIVNQYERNKEKNAKLIEKLEEQKKKAEKMIDEGAKNKLIAEIDYKINQLMTPIQYLQAGEYTKAAIAYKKAADTTIYGLSKDATTADVLRALPKYDRDFFLDFANEKDPKRRKEILQYVSPYKAKALKIMWGEEVDEAESNANFFNNHNLPNLFWAGWQPQVDLEHIKMKTIENEGMLLSDFGMYDSNLSEPAAQAAPEIEDIRKGPNPISLQTNLLSLMNGAGFQNVDVSVEPTNKPGIQMITNVTRIASYNINNSVSNVLNKLLL